MKMMKLVVFVVDLAFTAFVLFELCVCSLYFVACFAGFFMLFFFSSFVGVVCLLWNCVYYIRLACMQTHEKKNTFETSPNECTHIIYQMWQTKSSKTNPWERQNEQRIERDGNTRAHTTCDSIFLTINLTSFNPGGNFMSRSSYFIIDTPIICTQHSRDDIIKMNFLIYNNKLQLIE